MELALIEVEILVIAMAEAPLNRSTPVRNDKIAAQSRKQLLIIFIVRPCSSRNSAVFQTA